jgi:hypothetical protein
MRRIAAALGVSAMEISRDLEGFDMTSKPSRPRGGRPKGGAEETKRRSGPQPKQLLKSASS